MIEIEFELELELWIEIEVQILAVADSPAQGQADGRVVAATMPNEFVRLAAATRRQHDRLADTLETKNYTE